MYVSEVILYKLAMSTCYIFRHVSNVNTNVAFSFTCCALFRIRLGLHIAVATAAVTDLSWRRVPVFPSFLVLGHPSLCSYDVVPDQIDPDGYLYPDASLLHFGRHFRYISVELLYIADYDQLCVEQRTGIVFHNSS